ncbi:MAG: DegV family protein [Chloroflexi bacterium]|nr:DegV family protein [Chloroflexota bacterium]
MVRIVSDTTASLPPQLAEQYHIPIVPQIVSFGDESYREGVDLDTDMFIRMLRSQRNLPKTAAPPPQFFRDIFQNLGEANESIICIHPSCQVSGTVRSAQLAAADFPKADIHIIDTRTIAYALGMMVMCAAELAQAGESAEAIVEHVHQLIRRSRTYFRVATLDYLARGGRIGGAAALLGSMLQVKPILTFRDGYIDQYARGRTEYNAMNRMVSIIAQQCPKGSAGMPALMYDGTAEQREFATCLAQRFGAVIGCEPLPLYCIPPAILTHVGPKVVGVGFFLQDDGDAY